MKDSAKKKKINPIKSSEFVEYTRIKFDKWYILPLLSLLIILLVLTVYNANIKQQIADYSLSPAQKFNLSPYPYIPARLSPQISAESALIYDDTSKVVIYEKKPSLRFSMASTTKIMTALVALEKYKMNDILTIQSLNQEGAIIGFQIGEKISFENLLYALLLPSANDAAVAIAENYPGGSKAFVGRMNEKAKELNLLYTHYADPAGLEDDGNYTTVTDLAKLASFALKNVEIAKIIATKEKVITSLDGINTYEIKNLNKLLRENGVIGVKTGYTQGAGEVLVTAKYEKDHLFIIIVLKSKDRFADTQTLIRLISDKIEFINPADYILNKNSKKL